jgi:L,D-transpeptidase YbiS
MIGVALGTAGVVALALGGTGYDYEPARTATDLDAVASTQRGDADPALRHAARQVVRLTDTLRRQVPRGSYVVIDQTHNRIRLLRGDTLVLEAPCSAGSGLVLRESGGGRVWVFDTPRGAFTVRSKIRNPVWKKPDWAFVEEGVPIPSDPGERFEYGVLGEYALYFGNGYMIHGTLYERLIGRPVSHGCIRVGREALREIYGKVPLGAPIFIY